jgi:hypothetical protein
MKTAIFSAMLLMTSVFIQAQINFHSSIETGYENRELTFQGNGLYTMNNSCYSVLSISSDYKNFSLYTNTKTFYKPIATFYNSPKQIEFYIGMKYNLTKKLSFGFEHLCSHSIDSDIFYDSYNRISIKFIIL